MILSNDKNFINNLVQLWGHKDIMETTSPHSFDWGIIRYTFEHYLISVTNDETMSYHISKWLYREPEKDRLEYIIGYLLMKCPTDVSMLCVLHASVLRLSEIYNSVLSIDWTPIEESSPTDFNYVKSWGRMLVRPVDGGNSMEDKMIQYYNDILNTKGLTEVLKDVAKVFACTPTTDMNDDPYKQLTKVWGYLHGETEVEKIKDKGALLYKAEESITQFWGRPDKTSAIENTYSGVVKWVCQMLYPMCRPDLDVRRLTDYCKMNSLDIKEGIACVAGVLISTEATTFIKASCMYHLAKYLIDNDISVKVSNPMVPPLMEKPKEYADFGKYVLGIS